MSLSSEGSTSQPTVAEDAFAANSMPNPPMPEGEKDNTRPIGFNARFKRLVGIALGTSPYAEEDERKAVNAEALRRPGSGSIVRSAEAAPPYLYQQNLSDH